MRRRAPPRCGSSGVSCLDSALPILIVEVLSPATRRRDHEHKRDLYVDVGIAEYWIVDPESESIRVVRPATSDAIATDRLTWAPAGAKEPLVLELGTAFR